MKRCPTCNRTFDEDWLAFCTQDGTTLVEEASYQRSEPPPTILAPPPPPPAGNWQQPSGGIGSGQFQSQPAPPPVPPSNLGAPSGGIGSGQFQPGQQMQSGWQPPPPPSYAAKPAQGLAIASLIVWIFSVTLGWCYLGILSGPVAVALGIASLVQINKKPEQYGGKGMAIAGVVMGAIAFLGMLVFFIFFVLIAATSH